MSDVISKLDQIERALTHAEQIVLQLHAEAKRLRRIIVEHGPESDLGNCCFCGVVINGSDKPHRSDCEWKAISEGR